MTATLEFTKTTIDPALEEYMVKCGGRDILVFESSSAASDAAHTMRERGVSAEARYERVFVSHTVPTRVRRAVRRA